MKDRRKRNNVVSWTTFFWCTLLIVFSSIVFTTFTLSPFRPFYLSQLWKWRTLTIQSKNNSPTITIQEIVMLPDEALIFLYYPPSFRFYDKCDLRCVYFSADSSRSNPQLTTQPPIQLHSARFHEQIVRCPLPPRGNTISLLIKAKGIIPTKDSSSIQKWDPLVYETLLDKDNTTIVFVKGLNLRSERLNEPSRFQCLYGWDFTKPKFFLKSDVVSAAQEIIRCKTPKSILSDQAQVHSIKVSIQVKDKGIFPSIARPGLRSALYTSKRKAHEMCVCTMLHNQARFMKEWVMYHTRIGVQRWFIYDNNSDDDIDNVITFLQSIGYNITQHLWPWVKTQEAGFAHCALRARASCEWVGFIDVDEFFNVKMKGSLHHVIWHHAKPGNNVGEIRTPCYSYGPSGLREMPREGVMVGYTCRLGARERHKSIVRPEALNQSLINVVHHFHLSAPFVTVDVDNGAMVINHYKYQVWKVFKEKFYRRVATYVANWQDELNVGSKDRVPGLGTKAVEPKDWANRFCEVRDMGLRNWVLRNFMDRRTHLLPWQPEFEHHFKRRRRRKWKKPLMI
ncbi:glycosyltransferase family 92 protein RCOM_0530710 [Abrus precatorius]|uniref:Glycosyltransferase family 92 protein n=1 Tax=Abrus precatorius TaxID=3816 RepID=A0A8B8L4T3_ABRPR|nr:glycosyltransferase family 92 protein RCOM_0530710 [Abrus precatorius]